MTYRLCAAGAAGISLSLILLSLALVLGLPFHVSYLVVGVFGGALLVTRKESRRTKVISLISIVFLWWLCLLLANKLPQIRGDDYYEEAITTLRQGWNPFSDAGVTKRVLDEFRIYHYAKGAWLLQALLAALGKTKYAEGLLPFLSVLLGAGVLSLGELYGLSKGFRRSLALILALNPIAFSQLFSFYLDGILANCLLLEVIFLLHFGRTRNRDSLWLGVGVAVLAATTKSNGLVHATALAAPFLIYFTRSLKINWRTLVGPTAAYCLLVAIVGYSPYGKNLLNGNNPFHPLIRFDGQGYSYEKNGQMPDNFIPLGNVRRFVFSLFGKTDVNPKNAQWKPPFVVRQKELSSLRMPDIRVGGFGTLFSAAFLVSVLGAGVLYRQRRYAPLGLCAVLLLSTLACPQAWWFRFVPQFFAVPPLIAGILSLLHGPLAARLSRTLVGLLMINLVLFAYAKIWL